MAKYWWDGKPEEKYWMENTYRTDIGGNLKAPQKSDTGKSIWGYDFLKLMKRGDIIFHYDANKKAITHFSTVESNYFEDEIKWKAKGSYARERNSQNKTVPSYEVPITGLTKLERAITIDEVGANRAGIEEGYKKITGSKYAPFDNAKKRKIGAFQAYITKFPKFMIDIFKINELRPQESGSSGDIKSDSLDYFVKEPTSSLPASPVLPLPPPSFQNPRPEVISSVGSDSKLSKRKKSGPRKPELGLVYIRAIYAVNDQEKTQLGSAFKHGLFGVGNEEKRRNSGYTDLPPFDENGLWLASEFVAVAGPFKDVMLAEKEFSNQLVTTWNIRIGIGNQKEWHPYQSSNQDERVKELVEIVSELSSFAKEKGVKFESRPTYYTLCG